MKGFDLSGLEDGARQEDGPDRRRVGIAPPPRQPASSVPSLETSAPARSDPAFADTSGETTDTSMSTPPKARRPRSTVRRGAKTTVRLFPDQRGLLARLADERGVWRTELLAAAIDRYASAVGDDGPILRPPRRPKGPLPGEELRDYQIAIDGTHWRQLQVVADRVSGGDCSAVLRRALDRAFIKAGYELADRPAARPTARTPIDI
jgi:hypothetical protein